MSGLMDELQVATSFTMSCRMLAGRLSDILYTYTENKSVIMTKEINLKVQNLENQVMSHDKTLNNEEIAQRYKELEGLLENIKVLLEQRTICKPKNPVEAEPGILEDKVKLEMRIIEEEFQLYQQMLKQGKGGSVIEQNKDVLQQGGLSIGLEKVIRRLAESSEASNKFAEEHNKILKESRNDNIEHLVEEIKEVTVGNEKLIELMTKVEQEALEERLRVRKEKEEAKEPLEKISIKFKPFKVVINIYKETERRYKDSHQTLDTLISNVKKMHGSELHKMGAYLTIIQSHCDSNQLDSKTILDLLTKCFGDKIVGLATQDHKRDGQKVKKVLKGYLKKKLGKEGMKVNKYMKDFGFPEKQGMQDNETCSQWYDRFDLCMRSVKMDEEEEEDAALTFTCGITEKWKTQHRVEAAKMLKAKSIKDILNLIPFDDENQGKNFTVKLKNKNTSNYPSSNFYNSPKNINKIGNNFRPNNRNNTPVLARGSNGFWNNKERYDGWRRRRMAQDRDDGEKVMGYDDIGRIFDIVNKKRIELLEEKIQKAKNIEKSKQELPKTKLYVELTDRKGRPYKWLVDSGSPIHIIREDLLQQYEIPYTYRKIEKYRGVGHDSFVNVTGTNKNTYMIAGIPTEIECVVARDFPENILSWQKLTETFDDIIWKESKDERIVAFGSVQLMRGRDNVYRPLRKFDMEKLNQKIDDRKENQFVIEDNLFQLSDLASKNIMVVSKERELHTVKWCYRTKPKEKALKIKIPIVLTKIRTYTPKILRCIKRREAEIVTKELKEHDCKVVYKRCVPKTYQIRMEVMRDKEDTEMDNLIYNIRNMQSNQNVGWTRDECKEKLGKDIYQEMFDKYGEEVFEKFINTDLEDERQAKELEEELEQKKAEFGDKLEDKEISKEELKEIYEEIYWIDKLTRKKKKQFKWEKSRSERKKESKVKTKENRKLLKETENIIFDVLNLPEEEQEKIFQHARKIAKVKPNAMFPTWKEELEKGMFNKQELHRIWQDMKEENKFPKEEKPWLNQFDAWSDHILRNLVCDEKIKTRIKEGIKKLLKIPPLTFEQVYTNNGGIGVEIEIDQEDYNKEPMWYMNDVKLKAAQQFVDEMLQKGFVEEIDEDEANCIVNLVVQIKDGKVRVCMDFSRMNKFVKNEYGSFFSVEEIIDQLDPNDKVGFVADLKGAFHNVLLSEESSKKCCFWFNGKAYRFKVLFFGISNGPFLFNEFLRKRLAPLKDIQKYIDDLFCTKKTVEELADSWERLVDMLVKYNIAISPEKLQFGPRLRLLGQYWQEGHLEMDFNKLIALRYVTVIRERKDLQKNLGMFMFLAKFSKGLSTKLDYFYKKTQEEPWSWTKYDAERLMRIWLEIESKTILFPYDNNKEIVLRTDAATNVGIGFSIIQYDEYGFERYIANYSKTLTPAQRNYSPIELEAYTIILALDKFYKYFVGRRFRIETDARSLTHIFNQVAEEKASKRIWRWTYILMQFDFYVVHIKGSDNVVSDWMSRHPVDIEALYRYLDEMESKQDHEQMDTKSQEEMEKFNTIISYISIMETQRDPKETLESGDNYKTPTWSLLYIFHKVLKKYLDEETYLEHCREIDKLQCQQDQEKRDKDTYSYILNHVVKDPCPFKESVERGSKDDGLNREIPWGRLNFVNSPYSKELLEGFIKRCMEEKNIGNTSVLLISFKYSKYIQDLLFKLPVKWDVLSILPSISFGLNNGRTYFPAMLLVEYDGSKCMNQSNQLYMSNFTIGKGTAFSLTRGEDSPSSVESIYDISDDKEWNMDEMTVDEEDIDDGVDLTQFDDYNSGFNQDLETIPYQEFRMFDPQVQDGGIDAYETIVRLLLANKELTKELLNPRFDLIRKQAERFLKYHEIIEDRLCFVDPKRKNKYNKGIRYYVPVVDRFKIYRLAHELNGHLSINYVMNYAQDYWWPNMYTHLKRKIEECAECSRFKKDRVQEKVVNTTPFYQPFQCGHVDLIGKLPGKYHYLLVYSDHCSKYTIAIPLKTKDADTVAKALLTRVYYVVGFVELMVHDNGGEFVNELMEAIARILGTRIRLTSVHHSSSNMVERKNKIIGQMIRCLVFDHHEKWHKFVPELVFAMNTYTPKGLLNSAFELTFGRRPWTVLDIVMNNKFKHENKDVDKWFQRLKYWVSINKALEWELRKNNYRPATKERVKVGNLVKISGEDTFPNAGSKKFQPYQSGPYKVLEVKDGSATLEKLVAQGEKERTLTAPTYKLTEYTMPQDNPEMPDPIVNTEDYIPIEIISESTNEDGIQTYTVRGKYFGKEDIELWTAEEFDTVENKHLLEEWNKIQEEEKLLLDQEKAKGKKRRVINLIDVNVDENGIATFQCEVSEKKILTKINLKEESMSGVKKRIIPFMSEHGYIRGPNGTWIKKQDDHIFDIRKVGKYFNIWKMGPHLGMGKQAKMDAIPTSGDIPWGINIAIDSISTN